MIQPSAADLATAREIAEGMWPTTLTDHRGPVPVVIEATDPGDGAVDFFLSTPAPGLVQAIAEAWLLSTPVAGASRHELLVRAEADAQDYLDVLVRSPGMVR